MRIEWIEVENFKGFDKRRFEFDEYFTLVVGENGTGKSSLVEALQEAQRAFLIAAFGISGAGDPSILRVLPRWLGESLVPTTMFPLRVSALLMLGDSKLAFSGELLEGEPLRKLGIDFAKALAASLSIR